MADLVVVKTSDGLEVSLPGLLSDCTASYKICACRIERLANEHGGQNGAVVRFLEALRQDWMDHSYDKCNDSRCESEDDEYDNCVSCQDLILMESQSDKMMDHGEGACTHR